MTASYNGVSLGLVFSMSTMANSNARQINTYPGANGLEIINQGSRGGTTTVDGALVGAGPSGLASIEQTFRNFQVGGANGVLVDNLGTTWFNVILVGFRPIGRITPMVSLVPGTYFGRRYEMEFLHTY